MWGTLRGWRRMFLCCCQAGGHQGAALAPTGSVLVEINLPRDVFLWRGDDFQGSGLLVPGMATPGGGTAQGARLEGQSLLTHSSGRVCSSINTRSHF